MLLLQLKHFGTGSQNFGEDFSIEILTHHDIDLYVAINQSSK